ILPGEAPSAGPPGHLALRSNPDPLGKDDPMGILAPLSNPNAEGQGLSPGDGAISSGAQTVKGIAPVLRGVPPAQAVWTVCPFTPRPCATSRHAASGVSRRTFREQRPAPDDEGRQHNRPQRRLTRRPAHPAPLPQGPPPEQAERRKGESGVRK